MNMVSLEKQTRVDQNHQDTLSEIHGYQIVVEIFLWKPWPAGGTKWKVSDYEESSSRDHECLYKMYGNPSNSCWDFSLNQSGGLIVDWSDSWSNSCWDFSLNQSGGLIVDWSELPCSLIYRHTLTVSTEMKGVCCCFFVFFNGLIQRLYMLSERMHG